MRIRIWSSYVCASDLPEAVVDQLGIFRHQLILEMRRPAIERDLFDPAMRAGIDLAARRLIHPPALHPDEPVFDQIEPPDPVRSEEHTSELQSLMRISYAVFCLKKKKN